VRVQAIDHHARLDYEKVNGDEKQEVERQDFFQGKFTFIDNLPNLNLNFGFNFVGVKKKYGYSTYLLGGMGALLCCLAFLLLGVCYYSVKEVRLHEEQVKIAYEKSILRSNSSSSSCRNSRKVSSPNKWNSGIDVNTLVGANRPKFSNRTRTNVMSICLSSVSTQTEPELNAV